MYGKMFQTTNQYIYIIVYVYIKSMNIYIYGIISQRDIQKQQQKHGGLAHISRVISLSWFMFTRVELIFR